jgi:hypothetical protein
MMTRWPVAAGVIACLLTACGEASTTGVPLDPSTNPSAALTEVAGPSDFSFIVDGPLVTNGPPWECTAARDRCSDYASEFLGTIELVDDCILVHAPFNPPGVSYVVIFEYGVTWDEATSTIHGLGPNPVGVGDTTETIAIFATDPDTWTSKYGMPSVPTKVRDCMKVAGTDEVYVNTPWYGVGVISSTVPETSIPRPATG